MLAVTWVAAIADGCAATSGPANNFTGGSRTTSGMTTKGGTGGVTSSSSTTSDTGLGGALTFTDAGSDVTDANDEAYINPCGSKCGPTELCDPAHTGLDDNCNGDVDEGCPCTPGQVHWCFKGDPSYRGTPGCFDGSETCSELGQWGPCTGGVHAWPPDDCFLNNTTECHAITAIPGATVDLKTGTGQFSVNAVPGSETYSVQCPMGVSQCPAVMPPENFSEIQSGQYTVTYTKMVAGDPNPISCTFPLFIGDIGLRVELSWEHHPTDDGVDLDLHVHQPQNTQPWGISPGEPQDCTWSSCKIDQIQFNDPVVPQWWPTTNMQPMPCNWDIQTSAQSLNNSCYNDPRGVGEEWQLLGKGCHNPRSDIDNITCDDTVTDPTDPNWCGPEVINVDYPPLQQWFRVAVHYYYNHAETYDIHPEIKIFCNGALSADWGPHGFYVPETPPTFESADGAGTGSGNRFWIVGDVAFVKDSCGNVSCVTQPLYSDPTNKTPLFTIDTAATSTFAPPWPPPPQ